jgi:hypothetical protein
LSRSKKLGLHFLSPLLRLIGIIEAGIEVPFRVFGKDDPVAVAEPVILCAFIASFGLPILLYIVGKGGFVTRFVTYKFL